MDLEYTPEQRQLVDAAERFLARACPLSVVRAADGDGRGFDAALWREIAALGWLALELPADTGAGLSFVETVLVAEAMGRALAPCPFVSTAAVTLPLVGAVASPETRARWLPRIATGEITATVALAEPGWRDPYGEPALPPGNPTARLTGRKHAVPFAAHADLLVVVASGWTILAVESTAAGLSCTRLATLGGDPLYDVAFEGTPGVVLGRAEPALARHVLDRGAVASLAYGAGAAARALDITVEYAKTREQFGRPIGSFQAVAHRCADMRSDLDALRYLTYQAAWALAAGRDAALEVGAALTYGLEALRRLFVHAHQVHGAIGFSTEHDLHLFTRRAKAIELSWGAASVHRERVAQAMGL
jgi:alkylation response protein AidB-like acyl-CoA dehydrogenase